MKVCLQKLELGMSVKQAMAEAGRSYQTYASWRSDFPQFAKDATAAIARSKMGPSAITVQGSVPDFPEFCREFLNKPLPRHQERLWEILNGETPKDLHPSMTLRWGNSPNRVIANFPPDHAKTTAWSVNWVLWNIYKNPDIRIIVMSETEAFIKQVLQPLQDYLLDPRYEKLRALDPPGGWQDPRKPWRANYFYVRGRSTADPDPTVHVLGNKQQIYGKRCDILIVDDIESLKTAGRFREDAEKIVREGNSRVRKSSPDGLDLGGILLILGTRVGPMDVYRYLRDESKDNRGNYGFTYFAQPAILENEAFDAEDWTVLWPERMWHGAIEEARSTFTDPRLFQLVYQQSDINDEAPFPAGAVDASINKKRAVGPLAEPPDRYRVVAGLDPANTGGTAIVIMGVDGALGKRYILDVFYERDVYAERLIQEMMRLTELYGIQEWRVESAMWGKFMTQLNTITEFMTQRGVALKTHDTTGGTKWDADFGVTTLIPLFKSCARLTEDGQWKQVPEEESKHLIELPKLVSKGVIALAQQLKTWEPNAPKSVASDCVMALWFAECAAKDYILGRVNTSTTTGKSGRFVSPYMQKQKRRFSMGTGLMPEAYGVRIGY